MLYEAAVDFFGYVTYIEKYNKLFNLSKRLSCFDDEYRELAARAEKLENLIYPILEYNRIEKFKIYYDEIIDLNLKLINSPMFKEFSYFLANVSYMNDKYDLFAEQADISKRVEQKVSEKTEAIIQMYEMQKCKEVEQAQISVTENLK